MRRCTLETVVLLTSLAAVGCGSDITEQAANGTSQSALSPDGALATIEGPRFNVRGIRVTAKDDGLHIEGAFVGGNPGFLPPVFTMILDGQKVAIADPTWTMTSPMALAQKIEDAVKDNYNTVIASIADHEVRVQLRRLSPRGTRPTRT